MRSRFSTACWFALISVLLCIPIGAQAANLSKIEIGKLGKAATAFVERPDGASGTAFCIHPSGLFVTNEHVVRSAEQGELTLVLDPTLKTQRVLRAKVVRTDKERDLALLRVADVRELPSLQIGSVEGIAELMEVVAFGFPLGRALSPDRREYPAISVNAGRVTALRRKGGDLQQLQIDVALTFGNSGGPVLDDAGKVIGVVVSGVRLAPGLNQAIPVSHLDDFLKAPEIQFTPPVLSLPDLEKSVDFQARAVSILPSSQPIALQLVLKTDDGVEKRHDMQLDDGVYRVYTIVAQPDRVKTLQLAAQFETGMVSGRVADREIRVGEATMKLSECLRIQGQPKPTVALRSGKSVEGMATGLNPVALQIGGQTVSIDLNMAKTVEIQAPQPIRSIVCTIIASQGGQETGRVEATIALGTAAATSEPGKIVIKPPHTMAGVVTKLLPETAADIQVGGGGRFFVLHLPKLKKLAIFDVNEAKIVRYIPLSDDQIVFAAGLEKVFIGLVAKGIIERWNLNSGEKELSRALPGAADVISVLMGSASTGPVVINGGFFDAANLKPLPITTMNGVPAPWSPVSADGTVFGAWKSNQSPAESTSFVLAGDRLVRSDAAGVGHVVPGPDGRVLYTAKGICTSDFQAIRGSASKSSYCIPASEGDFYLALGTADEKSGGTVTVFMLGNELPLVKDAGIAHGVRFDSWDRTTFGAWKRVYFIPRAEMFVIFPPSNDRLELHHFNLLDAMEKSGLDYLLVTSQPPRTARPGTKLAYQVAVTAKHAGIRYLLDAGPPGMEISPEGTLSWNVPESFSPGDVDVILTITDGIGQEIFHTFKVRVGP